MRKMYNILARSAKKGPYALLVTYLEHISAIHAVSQKPYLLRSDIHCNDLRVAEDFIRFSCIFNDVSFASFTGVQSSGMVWPDAFNPFLGAQEVRFSASKHQLNKLGFFSASKQLDKLGIDADRTRCEIVLLMRNDEDAITFLKELHPVIKSGRLIIRPCRVIFVELQEGKRGTRNWYILDGEPESPFDFWTVVDEGGVTPPTPIRYTAGSAGRECELFNICLPFIAGIPLRDLNAVIDSEYDHIAALRAALKETIKHAQENKLTTVEAVRDVVEPKLNSLGRKFKTISNMHKLKVRGAVMSTVLLSYVGLSTSGMAAALGALAGAGGLGLLYADRQGKLAELKEDPLYFLWRCREIKRG